jgi:hypothetical protein
MTSANLPFRRTSTLRFEAAITPHAKVVAGLSRKGKTNAILS